MICANGWTFFYSRIKTINLCSVFVRKERYRALAPRSKGNERCSWCCGLVLLSFIQVLISTSSKLNWTSLSR